MKRIVNQKMLRTIVSVSIIPGMLMITSPAFSREAYSGSRGGEKQVTKVAEKRSKVEYQPVKEVREAVKVVRQPVTVVKRPVTVVQQPVTVVRQPVRVVQQPVRVVRQPVRVVHNNGSIVPAIIATGLIAGITMSLLDNDTHTPAACQTAPAAYTASGGYAAATGAVVVTADLLNVRSGPALTAGPVRQVPRGTTLSVVGNTSGWYQVSLSDGTIGWVMVQFTAPTGSYVAG